MSMRDLVWYKIHVHQLKSISHTYLSESFDWDLDHFCPLMSFFTLSMSFAIMKYVNQLLIFLMKFEFEFHHYVCCYIHRRNHMFVKETNDGWRWNFNDRFAEPSLLRIEMKRNERIYKRRRSNSKCLFYPWRRRKIKW